ncbi:MAG: hypothetical protein ABF289_19655, partial [Clostridiales bacterium]
MIKIITAMYFEAKPLIDYYKLQKSNSNKPFSIYKNDYIELIISGIGELNSAIATSYFLTKYKKTSFIINLGLCGSSNINHDIGKTFYINKIKSINHRKIFYPDIIVKHNFSESSLCTYNHKINKIKQISDTDYELLDMEAYGFYNAAYKFIAQDKISVIKILSDHLNCNQVEIDLIYSIIKSSLPKLSDFFDNIIVYTEND